MVQAIAEFKCYGCGRAINTMVCGGCSFDNTEHHRLQRMEIAAMFETTARKLLGDAYRRPTWITDCENRKRTDLAGNWASKKKRLWYDYSRGEDRGIIAPRLRNGFKPKVDLIHGDALAQTAELETDSIDACITSLPYYQKRDYNVENDLGRLPTVEMFIDAMLGIFNHVKRVLKPHGNLFIDIDDTFATSKSRTISDDATVPVKSRLLIPERVAIAFQEHGWIPRARIIVAKTNRIPENNKNDRTERAYHSIYHFVKAERGYYFNQVKDGRRPLGDIWDVYNTTIGTGNHPAPMILQTVRWCVEMGVAKGGTVLDPFCGSGQTGFCALEHSCHFVGIDANKKYLDEICHPRLVDRISREPIENADTEEGGKNTDEIE